MIQTIRTFASFSVDNIDAARRFYSDTLGMKVSDQGERGPLWLQGPDGHDTLVYFKPDHVPATFTVLNFAVDNIEKTVDELASGGVRFERYEGMRPTVAAFTAAQAVRSRGSPTRQETSCRSSSSGRRLRP